jgi:hypothetical protein
MSYGAPLGAEVPVACISGQGPAVPKRRVLMVAYHFPPLAGSSGIQRTLRFVQHLPTFGWLPLVLTIKASAYERISPDLDAAVPDGVTVRRAIGFDAARQLAIGGSYMAWMSRPDRWMTWRFDGVRQALRMVREFEPQVLWTTYPIATAHVIGAEVQRRTGLPWVADFRDPMVQDNYPDDAETKRQFEEIERRAVERASLHLFTTPSALQLYRQRYPQAALRMELLENGYDEDSFAGAESTVHAPLNPGHLTLLHSGIVYSSERDPTQLFKALGQLKRAGGMSNLMLRFRAAVHDDLLRSLAEQHDVKDLVEVYPPVPYREALSEMLCADGLLVLQAENCNAQIPAKVYEYLRARRPILCLSHPAGDTEAALRQAGVNAHARLDDARAISLLLRRFVADYEAGALASYSAHASAIHAASRRGRTETLAQHLDRLATR